MKLLVTIVLLAVVLGAQSLPPGYFDKKGEVYFSFTVPSKSLVDNVLANMISLDKVDGTTVYAYANKDEFGKFLNLGYQYRVLPHPGEATGIKMGATPEEVTAWDTYPTYDAYITMMNQFAASFPNLCKIYEIGTTAQGRKLLVAKISDNVSLHEGEPEFLYASSIHGDETTGYVLMLRLIDYLLNNYGTDSLVTRLVNNVQIYINPLHNPDGTYRSGNTTVVGSTRANSNNVDINRNFPDPAAGPHPDGYAWQAETMAMTAFFHKHRFVMSANFHGGVEVVNYPWDTWSRLHADDTWWVKVSRNYADTVHVNAVASYMRYLNDGITNGYAWYRITGGRQDYMTYFMNGREVTIEISNTKLLSGSLLPAHWNYNYRSFLRYIESVLFGIKGFVTDINGNPLKAKITVTGHEADNSFIFSDSLTGHFVRMIAPGTYSVTVSADSFISQTFTNLVVSNNAATPLNVQLQPTNPVPVELGAFTAVPAENGMLISWRTITEKNNRRFELERRAADASEWLLVGSVDGAGTTVEPKTYSLFDVPPAAGTFMYRLRQTDFDGTVSYKGEVMAEFSRPSAVSLGANYPNPFNPSTTIRYGITERSFVSLKVYNTLGVLVAGLEKAVKDAGSYQVLFDAREAGRELPSGVYYSVLEVKPVGGGNGMLLTGKMILAK